MEHTRGLPFISVVSYPSTNERTDFGPRRPLFIETMTGVLEAVSEEEFRDCFSGGRPVAKKTRTLDIVRRGARQKDREIKRAGAFSRRLQGTGAATTIGGAGVRGAAGRGSRRVIGTAICRNRRR